MYAAVSLVICGTADQLYLLLYLGTTISPPLLQAQGSPHNTAAEDAAELADLFSPLPNTSGGRGGGGSTGGASASGGGGKGGTSNKKARISSAVDRYVLLLAMVLAIFYTLEMSIIPWFCGMGQRSMRLYHLLSILPLHCIILTTVHTTHHSLRSSTLPRAVWDLDDDGPDLLEQRSLALMKSTGTCCVCYVCCALCMLYVYCV